MRKSDKTTAAKNYNVSSLLTQ